jgi:shikimate kinase
MLVLVGMPGSGKSTVGRWLAQTTALPFIDLDRRIEEKIGCLIVEFFASESEERFRDVESEALMNISHLRNCVLATGGGTVLRQVNRQWLRQQGEVVYLYATPAQLIPRLSQGPTRPLLQVSNPSERLTQLYQARDSLYRETAHHVVLTGTSSANKTAQTIVDTLGKWMPEEIMKTTVSPWLSQG